MQPLDSLHRLVQTDAEQPDLTLRVEGSDPEAVRVNRWLSEVQAVVAFFSATTARVATRAARTTAHAGKVGQGVRTMRENTAVSVEFVGQTRTAAAEVAESAAGVAELGSDVMESARKGAELSQLASQQSRSIADEVRRAESLMQQFAQTLREVGRFSEVISDVARQTNLLSLNAAIEAARAGEHGRGFSVVAAEVRRLADRTHTSTTQIARLLSDVQQQLKSTSDAVYRSAELATAVAERTEQADAAAQTVADGISNFVGLVDRIASSVEQQKAALHETSQRLSEMDAEARRLAVEVQGLEDQSHYLVQDAEQAYGVMGRVSAGTFVDQVRRDAEDCAEELEALFDEAITQGRVTLNDALDVDYRPITGPGVRSLARLFNVDRVPASGFTPTKYSTRYSEVLDAEAMRILDRYLGASDRYLFFIAADLNAYCFTHNSRNVQDWTGDPETDSLHSRLKRIYDEPVVIAASRVGLKGTERLPHPATRAQFAAAGAVLDRPLSAFFAHTYLRDDGAATTLFSVPLHVRGQRFGAVCVAWLEDI